MKIKKCRCRHDYPWTTISLDMKEKVKVSIMGSMCQSTLKANFSIYPLEIGSEYMFISTNFVIAIFKQHHLIKTAIFYKPLSPIVIRTVIPVNLHFLGVI